MDEGHFFEGFTDELREVTGGRVRVRHGGSGLPVLLIHGHPRTGATWHMVAARLVRAGFTVVVPDMPGYGQSDCPPIREDHSQQSKRAVAAALVELMASLGHDRFHVAGHDRGSYVALRLTLDHPRAVERLAVLDGIPITEHLTHGGWEFARRWWHWFFFAAPEKPERAILADPARWYGGTPEHMGQHAWAEFQAAIHDPDTVRAMLEDYRAGLGVDREHEEADRAAGRRVECPTLLLWSRLDDLELIHPDPLARWRDWATDISGHSIETHHHMAEEDPKGLARALSEHFAGG